MTTRKRTDSLSSSLCGPPNVRQRTAEDHGGRQVKPDVGMAAPPAKEPPAGPSTSSEASRELADPSAPRSELVKDTFSNTKSEEFDQRMQGDIPQWKMGGSQIYCANGRLSIIQTVVQLCSELDRKYVEESAKLIKNNSTWLPPLLDKCWEKGEFCVIRRLKILRPANLQTSASQELDPLNRVTVKSWGVEYMGNAADVLLKTISSYLVQVQAYGASSSILNSSGTGKSRMVDELSKKIITVPICLREGYTGFPPPDVNLRNWFRTLSICPRNDATDRLLCFMSSLLNVTLTRLQAIEQQEDDIKKLTDLIAREANPSEKTIIQRQELLAKTFRELMTDGQTFKAVNDYRRLFFDDIIAVADEAVKDWPHPFNPPGTDLLKNRKEEVGSAGKKLKGFVDPRNVLEGNPNTHMRRPFVIFSFDEAHELTKCKPNENWSIYIELRHSFTYLDELPFFFLFLSTSGKFLDPTPETRWGPSTLIADDSHLTLPPITETGFDQFAFTAIEGQTTLEEVMTNRWIAHLGRPLFGSRYKAGGGNTRSSIVLFARSKLLAGPDPINMSCGDTPSKPLDKALACFSVRFPLEFNFAHRETRTIVGHQIEHHMRLCTIATSGFETLFSTVGSEPLLAEAASIAMNTDKGNLSPVSLLSDYMDVNCISVGEHGELVAALLVMQVRDALAKSTGERSVGVIDFMEKLVSYPDIRAVLPHFTRENEGELKFQEAFKDSRIWMNHVLKVQNTDLINVKHLWAFVTRGAMLLCANGQRGIDLVIPVVHSGGVLTRHAMTAILIQVKNDENFATVRSHLFDEMNPLDVGVFDSTAQSRPVIRMVFALASDTCEVTHVTPERRSQRNASKSKNPSKRTKPSFTAYDFWCSGLDTKTFPIIHDRDRYPYKHLLARTRKGDQLYDVESGSVATGTPMR